MIDRWQQTRPLRVSMALCGIMGAFEHLQLALHWRLQSGFASFFFVGLVDVVAHAVAGGLIGLVADFVAGRIGASPANRTTIAASIAVFAIAASLFWPEASGSAARMVVLGAVPIGLLGLTTANVRFVADRSDRDDVDWPLPIDAFAGLLAAAIVLVAGVVRIFALDLSIPAPADKDAPNVLLISIDTLRRDAIGAYGEPLAAPTPRIDGLAADGALFLNAVTPMPETAPAHAAMLTGLHPVRTRVVSNGHPLSEGFPTLAEALDARGYATGAFVSSFAVDARTGLDQGFQIYDDALPPGPPGLLRIGNLGRLAHIWAVVGDPARTPWLLERSAPATRASFESWLAEVSGRPFFAWVHFFEPHAPYESHDLPGFPPVTVDHRSRMGPDATFTDAERAELRDRYREEVAYVDGEVGALIDDLHTLALDDETLVIVIGDHGEMLGEHDIDFTHHSVYEEAVRIPLVVHAPGPKGAAGRGAKVQAQVRTMDVAATILAWTGTTGVETEGFDLLEYASGRRSRSLGCTLVGRRERSYSAGALVGLRYEGVKYVHDLVSGQEQLFFLDTDPTEADDRFDWSRANDAAGLQKLRSLVDPDAVAFQKIVADELPTSTVGESAMLEQLGYQK